MSDSKGRLHYKTFLPDLIIEVTSVCDRACPGCYAPNFVSGKSRAEINSGNPSLFLTEEQLQKALTALTSNEKLSTPVLAAFRGGEPTRSAILPILLSVAKQFGCDTVIETHGRWIIDQRPEEITFSEVLFDRIRETNTLVKLSFDEMHGLSTTSLQKITMILDLNNIEWNIAITEPSFDRFLISRKACNFAKDHQIIFQEKAFSKDKLVQPRFGVIHTNGERTYALSNRFLNKHEVSKQIANVASSTVLSREGVL